MPTTEQLRAFLNDDQTAARRCGTRTGAYQFMQQTLQCFDYLHLGRSDRGSVRRFLVRTTGLSRAQVTRLVHQHRATGRIVDHRHATARSFPRRYTTADTELLAEVDALHGSSCGPTTRALCTRAWRVFGDGRFERLAGISNGHLYNLRRSTIYRRRRATMPEPTHPVWLMPDEHRRPRPCGIPGHLRVVSLRPYPADDPHPLHHVSLVDEVTQFQFVVTLERLDVASLKPIVDAMHEAFPFAVRSIRAGTGADRRVRRIAGMLHRLHLANGRTTADGGHAGVLPAPPLEPAVRSRRRGGCGPSPRVQQVNAFSLQVLAPYLNYHRPRRFPATRKDLADRPRTRRRDTEIMTPYERLKSLPAGAACLRPGTSFAQLDAIAVAVSDNEAALALGKATVRLLSPRVSKARAHLPLEYGAPVVDKRHTSV